MSMKIWKPYRYTKSIDWTYWGITSYGTLDVYDFIHNKLTSVDIFTSKVRWIPHFQIKNLMKIAEGRYDIIYSANYQLWKII